VLSGHLGIVRCLHISDQRLVSGGDQKKIGVWDYRVLMPSYLETKPCFHYWWYFCEAM